MLSFLVDVTRLSVSRLQSRAFNLLAGFSSEQATEDEGEPSGPMKALYIF
jgi:hypothetical protein